MAVKIDMQKTIACLSSIQTSKMKFKSNKSLIFKAFDEFCKLYLYRTIFNLNFMIVINYFYINKCS